MAEINNNIDFSQLAKNCKNLKDVHTVVKSMMKGVIEGILQEELNQHLGYQKHSKVGSNSGNSRNGTSSKTVLSTAGEIEIAIPRDRNGEFSPQLVKSYQTDISEFDERIISMYARGMTTRDIQAHVQEIYGAEISPTMVSMITDKVLHVAHEWQQRPLASVYVITYFDAIFYKVRDGGKIVSKAAYTCLGVDINGNKDILGLWIGSSEGATYWLSIMNELKARGVKDIFIACIDGLKGMGDAIETAFPRTEIQRCVIHMMRNSFKYVAHKNSKQFIADLKLVYTAASESEARYYLGLREQKWGTKYPLAVKPWVEQWAHVSTYFKYPAELRRLIYTTNAVEALHRQFRKVSKNRTVLATDESLFKLLFLAARDIQKKWLFPVRGWTEIATQLHVFFNERVTAN
jgi:putative transposase